MNLVILGLGYSAAFFARAALREGWNVVGTSRSAERAGELSREGLHTLVFGGDAVSTPLAREIAQADAVLVSIPPGEDGDPALELLGAAIAQAPALGWIGYLSTVGVYGDHGGAWVDETTPCSATSPRIRARLASEEGWLRLAADCGKAGHVFRLSGIYGPGRNALVKLREGRAQRLVKPGQVFNRIHVDDIAGALLASLGQPRGGAVYNVSDDLPAPPQDVITLAAEIMGIAPPPEIPFEAARLSPMAAAFYAQNRRVSNALIKQELGYRFRYPTYREALPALWDAMR